MKNNISSLDKSTAKVVIFLASNEMTKSKVGDDGLRLLLPPTPGRAQQSDTRPFLVRRRWSGNGSRRPAMCWWRLGNASSTK